MHQGVQLKQLRRRSGNGMLPSKWAWIPPGRAIHAFVNRISNKKDVSQLIEALKLVQFGPIGKSVVTHVQNLEVFETVDTIERRNLII